MSEPSNRAIEFALQTRLHLEGCPYKGSDDHICNCHVDVARALDEFAAQDEWRQTLAAERVRYQHTVGKLRAQLAGKEALLADQEALLVECEAALYTHGAGNPKADDLIVRLSTREATS